MLQHFLVNSQTIIKRWYFHMKFNTHILDILEYMNKHPSDHNIFNL